MSGLIFNHLKIQSELERWKLLVGHDEYISQHTLGIHDVLDAHFLLQDHFFDLGEGVGGIGPKDLNILHSSLSRQFTGFGGRRKWLDPFELVGTLFFGLICNHPFHDCNKRTALLSSALHLDKLGRVPEIPELQYENLTVHVADKTLHKLRDFSKFSKQQDAEIKFLAYFFRNHSRRTNKRAYIITYQELSTILQRFGCRFGSPDGNFIHVEKRVEKRRFFGPTRVEWQSVVQIRFPGMSREANFSDLKRIRKALNLTAQDGVDSDVFFYGSEPLRSFITRYERPLRRLADR